MPVASKRCFPMSWLTSLFIALLSGVAGLFLAGFIANACVTWYQISSREGASGFFVIFMALLGGVAGLIVGLIAARMTAGYVGPSFGKELLAALGAVLVTAGFVALLCRLNADVPPTIDGQELMLQVEFRFPNSLPTDQPPTSDGTWEFTLASLAGYERRSECKGVVHANQARLEDGRWIVPTEAELFTERGKRTVTLAQQSATEVMGFVLPVPRRPGPEHENWSDWFPRQQADGTPWPADKTSCRFRVQRVSNEGQ
jgi:hypothetical protein